MHIIEGRKGKDGGDPRRSVEHRNTLYSRTTAKILDAISEGVCYGLADQTNPEKCVYFDGVPVMNADGTLNFEGVQIVQRYGYPDQPYVEGFSEVESTIDVGETVEQSSPAEVSFTGQYDAVRVTLNTPALTYLNPNNGDLEGNAIEYKIEVQVDSGGYYQAVPVPPESTEILEGKNTSTFPFSYRINLWDFVNDVSESHTYDIRVTRITEDFDDDATRNGDLVFQSYTTIIEQKMAYPDTAYIAILIDGFLFGDTVLGRQYLYKGLVVNVPDNYDPETREYSGVWGGVFKLAWTNNPAWCLYDLLTNRRYGLGADLQHNKIDYWKFYEIAQYCDELVPDGKGGTEPRFTFNAYITTRYEAYQLVNMFASAFAGMIYWGTGVVQVGQDSPADVDYVFNPSNVIGGVFNRSGTSLKSKFSSINVTWRNPDREYRREVEVVESPDLIKRFGLRTKDVVAFWCTSQGEARRLGLRMLDNERYGEMINFKTGLEGLSRKPADIVEIQDPSHAGVTLSGRIREVVSNGLTHDITFDRSLDFTPATDYTISVVLPDGSLQSVALDNPETSSSVVTTSEALTDIPLANSMFAIESGALSTEKIRIISVVPSGKNLVEITGVLYDENKYARIEDDLYIPPPITSQYPTETQLPAPIELSVQEVIYIAGVTAKSKAILSWRAGNISELKFGDDHTLSDPRVTRFEVEYQNPFSLVSGWEPIPNGSLTSGHSITINETNYGTYKFRVRARDNRFRTSAWSETLTVNLQSLRLPPDDVPSLSGFVTGETMNLIFTPVTNLDLSHYEIRFSSSITGVTWAEGQVLANDVPKGATTYMVPATSGTYMIKAVDLQGDYSTNATLFVSTMASLFDFNVVTTISEDTGGWNGDRYNMQDDSGDLKLTLTEGVMDDWGFLSTVTALNALENTFQEYGIYYFSNLVDLGDVYLSRVHYAMNLTTDSNNWMSGWTNLSSVDTLAGNVEGETAVTLEVSTTEDVPEEDADLASDNGTDETTALSTGGAGNIAVFTNNSEYVIVGDASKFSWIYVELGTVASDGIDPTFEYWDGSAWQTFSPLDGTEGMTKTGRIRWDINDIGDWAVDGNTQYTIRITRTQTTVTTTPIADLIQISKATWSEWETLIINNYKARGYQYRITMGTTNINMTPVAQDCTITVDMPDRELTNTAVETSSAVATTSITFSPAFYAPNGSDAPSVFVSIYGLATGDYYEITNVSTTGFDIDIKNSGGTRIARNFDWVAKGWGSVQ